MTLEQLLDMSSDKLMAMSDEQLVKYFEPYFNVTRPERVARKLSATIDPDLQRRLAALNSMGIKVSAKDMTRKTKR